MARFYNPYHFVPVAPTNERGAVRRENFKDDRESAVTHERFVAGTYSGRLIVRLTTVTPTVVGNIQSRPHEKDFARIEQYTVDGIPAIAGSTLRGMTGSVIEAATNAPLRVLHKRGYSYRRKMESSLSAIGLLCKEGGEWRLKPMCLPTLESRNGGRSFEAPARFCKIFPTPQFKVYFGDSRSIRDSSFGYRTHLENTPPVSMPVKQLAWNGREILADRSLHVKGGRYLVAQDADARDPGRPGRVRVLGCWPKERVNEIPGTKKHELWIPEPNPNARSLPIVKSALERFEALANERTAEDKNLPFEPLETRPPRTGEFKFEPWVGDMVFFEVNDAGTEVVEFSHSAIWRARVEDRATREAATSWKFFGGIDPELLPANPKRTTISAAELLLGFADDVPDKETSALALASRVRFSDALPLSGDRSSLLLPPIVLKILGSPKQPCPALYFKPKGRSGYIEKSQLNPTEHEPQGRKWYLHAKSVPGTAPWASTKPDEAKTKGQKNIVEPIKAGTEFFSHIDFDNLSETELGLLMFGLEPDGAFHHKVGMGKPLGLGSVKVEVVGYFPINRIARYSLAGLRASRYEGAVLTAAGKELSTRGQVPARYAGEFASVQASADVLKVFHDHLEASGLISSAARRALSLLGNYDKAPSAMEVRYPTTADQVDRESELFKWFVFNDGHRERGRGMRPNRQFLEALRTGTGLPSLTELEWDEQKTGRGW